MIELYASNELYLRSKCGLSDVAISNEKGNYTNH